MASGCWLVLWERVWSWVDKGEVKHESFK